jgi:hypothetical protein
MRCLAILVARRLNRLHVFLKDVRSDKPAQMTARCAREWLASVGNKPLFVELESS